MKRAIACLVLAALILSAFGCKKPDDTDIPGYVPPDLSYPTDDNIDTENTDHDVPFDTDPSDWQPGATEPDVTEPTVTDEPPVSAKDTDKPDETEPHVTEPEETDPEETEPIVTEPADTTPEETVDDYVVPDVIIVPTEIPYVILSADGYYDFVASPGSKYFDKGINIYYTVPGEEGVIHMNKVDNYGFEKYIGVHQNTAYDLEEELIILVLSGELQDALIEKRLDPQINEIGSIGNVGNYPNFVWISTDENDYVVLLNDSTDEGYYIYTAKEYGDLLGVN